LRTPGGCWAALQSGRGYDEVYQLAADMGGMGFIESSECDIMRNNVLINTNMLTQAVEVGVPRYFFSSSVCVYPDMPIGAPEMTEDEAVPANPDNEYGWEKLYTERMIQAFARHHPFQARIARFQNCYGPYGTWEGGREKAPAALCRKVARAGSPDWIDVWGDGTAVRSYTYVDDLVDGIRCLMQSELQGPVNIGCPQYVSVDELAQTIANVAGKRINVNHILGPVGVQSRNFSNKRIESLGWKAHVFLEEGLGETYDWIDGQVHG